MLLFVSKTKKNFIAVFWHIHFPSTLLLHPLYLSSWSYGEKEWENALSPFSLSSMNTIPSLFKQTVSPLWSSPPSHCLSQTLPTWIEVFLDHYFILLLIPAGNHQIVFRTDAPVKLFKPAENTRHGIISIHCLGLKFSKCFRFCF